MPPDDDTATAEFRAFHAAPCGLLSTDRDGLVACVNDTLLDWLEVPRDVVVGRRRFADLLTPAGRIYAQTHLLLMLRVRGSFDEVALRLRSPSGVERQVLVSGRLGVGEGTDGASASFVLFLAEQRRSYERELMEMRAAAQTRVSLLRQVETMAGVGAWVLDVQTRSVTWSDQVFHLHDLPVGSPPTLDEALAFYPTEWRAQVASRIERAISLGEPFQFEAELVTGLGRRMRVRAHGKAEREMGRVVRVVGVFQDISEQHRIEQRLWRSAHVDDLSGLANRTWFRKRLDEQVKAAAHVGQGFALLLLDLDGFKSVNDTFGHEAGDRVIRKVAERLRGACAEGEFLARLGGDEFAILAAAGSTGADGVTPLAERIRARVRRAIPYDGAEAQVTTSIGIAFCPQLAATADGLLRCADAALYHAKRSGRDRYSLAREPRPEPAVLPPLCREG